MNHSAMKFTARRLKPFAAAALVAFFAGGCGGGGLGPMPEGPSWSLADKKPASLGATVEKEQSASRAAASPYEYRGGRDPVTGKSALAEGAPVKAPNTVVANLPSRLPQTTPTQTAAAASGKVVEVRKGDTLHGISLTHHVSVKALMTANNLKSTTIIPGKKLIIPAG